MRPTPEGPSFVFDHVRVSYPSRPAWVVALEGFDLAMSEGEFLAMVGTSGCGKTTLLNLAAGFLPPTSGSVTFEGRPVAGPSRERVLMLQEAALFPWLSVWQNVAFGLDDGQGPRAAARQKALSALDKVGLSEFAWSRPHELSGGMQQRVALARALVLRPKALLLDEPFGALDAITRRRMQLELARVLEGTQTSVLLVTHDVEEAVVLADRVAVLSPRPGKVVTIFDIPGTRPRDRFAAETARMAAEVESALGQNGGVGR